jgi:hypothetical protein
MGDRWRHNLT